MLNGQAMSYGAEGHHRCHSRNACCHGIFHSSVMLDVVSANHPIKLFHISAQYHTNEHIYVANS